MLILPNEISRDTLRRWHTEGILTPHTFTREGTGQRYYLRSEIEAFLNRPNGNDKTEGGEDGI
jgi:DNA-binding transcriptional MerR regulator